MQFRKRPSIIKDASLSCVAFFLTQRPWNSLFEKESDPVCYENYAFNENQAEGDIFFGTTIIYPGKVGSEYYMTRGHYHLKKDRAETYQALSGRGLVLFERQDGATCTAELVPGKVTYVPPFWAHRSVNTGAAPLVFLWTCPCDAGHDYESLAGRALRQVVVERDGRLSVEDRPARQA